MPAVRTALLVLSAALALLSACGASSPRVKVLGVSESQARARRTLLVFVEVVNPTDREIQLEKLEYQLDAAPWFETAGRVPLARAVAADSSAIIEIPVAVSTRDSLGAASAKGSPERGVPFRLHGRLLDRAERSWSVEARGAFDRIAGAPAARVVVAPR
jgi:hypothetical protein